MKSTASLAKLLIAAFLAFAPAVHAAFDPVNDDTDIFLANPNITAQRPNVLIILDNTANWNTPFTNEKNALVQVVNSLSDQFNVGLMMMVETGNPNDNVDGGYVRYHVRQMTSTNKTALSSMVNNLHILNDKGNNNTVGLALYEAYLYYAGKASNASFGKVKTDTDGTSDPLLSPLSGLHALPASPNSSSLYRSPIVDGCQKNFIIMISNGPANENASARAFLEGKLATLTGTTPPATVAITPNGQQGNWGDEMANYLANADVNTSLTGVQNVITYTIEVNPGTTGQGPDMTALFRSIADKGKGKYFGVTSDASGVAIVDALNQIFDEVQAVNSVFAASTLPVSVNVRGTNLNQVYVGVFRPDATKSPRWLGNLKLYNLALNTTTDTVFLADAANGPPPAVGLVAQNSATGFISGNAKSFWTTNSSFWSFRDASQNGVGGVSDSPDGDLVEKGAAAQQLRIAYAAAEAASPKRNVYTCTAGGTFSAQCTAGSSLSATPFADNNTDVDAVSLALDTRLVSPLTGLVSKAVTALTDRRIATLTNALSPTAVSSLSNGATTRAVTDLTTAVPKIVSALTGLTAGTQTVGVSSIAKVSGNTYRATTAATLTGGFTVGATVAISGNSVANFNGSKTISALTTTSFDFSCSGCGNSTGTGGTAAVTATSNSITATATLAGHGYADGQSVTITGASPSQFNGTFGITVIDTNSFRYTISTAAGNASVASGFSNITAAGNTTTATATTSVAHGWTAGQSVSVTGASPAGYNGTFTIASVPSTTTFTYTVASAIGANTASPVYAFRGGSTTVTVNAPGHTFVNGASVNIAGSDIAGYNGTFVISGVVAGTSFQYTTASVLPTNNSTTVTASTGFSPTVTATATNHGFVAGNTVVIEGGTETLHRGTFTVLASPVPTTNSFAYTNNQTVAPAGSYTVRPAAPGLKAIATVTAHNYINGDQVIISGATNAEYNGTKTLTVVDANSFTYPISTTPGTDSSVAITASLMTTTARATSVSHGFSIGNSVQISGATPGAFNGTFSVVDVPDANTFTYTLPSPQGDGSGTITAFASGASGTQRTNLINWVRGEDNATDENSNASLTDIRASIHGDVLHSRPVVVNYNRFGTENDVYVFYGANDGIFRGIKGGYASDAADPSGLAPGYEAWGFIPTEFFSQLNRLRNNSPVIGSSFKKPYFADGPTGVYTKDTDNNGKLGDATDKVNLYIAMRRGGRLLYALDVNNPVDPKYLWKISNTTTGFGELGQTWSEPKVVPVDDTGFSLNGYTNPVIVFGAGYDPAVEDIDPTTVTAATNLSVTTATGPVNRTMGRGIYVVDAITGALVWSAGKFTGATTNVSDMDFAIPSDVSVITNQSGGAVNRAYVGDTGGNVWRIDFKPSAVGANDLGGTTVTKLAALGDLTTAAGRRKFQFGPDVVDQQEQGFDAILIGSGDREHPFDTTVVNRMYMLKDKGNDAGPVTGTTVADPTIVESALFDATNNCIQDATICDSAAQAVATTALGTSSGWYLTLGAGEKVVGNAISLAGTTFFNTNQPDAGAGGGTCGANLGIARAYQVSTADATATNDLNVSGSLTTSDRSVTVAGGGYLPSPVHVVVMLDGKPREAVISGVLVSKPPGVSLSSRLRKYWYKEID